MTVTMQTLSDAVERGFISDKVAKQLKQQYDMKAMTEDEMRDAVAFIVAHLSDIDMERSNKRRAGAIYDTVGAKRAYWASRKFSKAQPWKTYGAMRVQRGTAENVARFGATARGASAAQKARRRMHGYTGRGSYFGKGLQALRAAGKAIGLRADRDSPIGKVYAGAMELDKGFDTAMDLYTGRGMYAPHNSTNSLIAGGPRTEPTMRSVNDETGSLIVTHRERVADVIAPGDSKFHVTSYNINPGLESFAPWVHQLAASYEDYEIIQCVYEYVGHELIGIQNNLDLQGQVIAATQYNVKLPPFVDRHAMIAYPHANACSLNGRLTHGVEAHPDKVQGDGHKLVRTGGLASTDDIRDYDHAKFSLAINNTPTDLFNKEIGQLYVYYTIKLIKPKIHAGRGKAISMYRQFVKNGPQTQPFGKLTGGTDDTTALVCSKNSLDMKFLGETLVSGFMYDAKWEFPAHANGHYLVQAVVHGAKFDNTGDLVVSQTGSSGEITFLNQEWLSTDAGSKQLGGVITGELAGENTVIMSKALLRVRPQIGATKNVVAVRYTFQGDDDPSNVSFIVMEINDFDTDDETVPEYKRIDINSVVGITL